VTYAVCLVPQTGKKGAKLRAFGAALEQAREAAGFSLATAARLATQRKVATISKPQLWQIEQGNAIKIDVLLLTTLASLYGVKFDYFVEALRWNRSHLNAQVLPDSIPAQEGPMKVTGFEEDFIKRFRKLSDAQQRDVIQHMAFTEAKGHQGAGETGATFRRKR
jgi:transcriptional regulator with XRE-family HTH domain